MTEENQALENSNVESPIENQEVGNTEAESTEVESQDTEEEQTTEDSNNEEDEIDDVEFPKKATRALERRNKKINKLRAEKAELEQKLAMFSQQQEQVSKPSIEGLKEPQEDDFTDYAEYLKAVGRYEAKKEYATKEAEAEFGRTVASQQVWVQQRAKQIDEVAAETAKTIPDLQGLYRMNQDIIEGFDDATKIAFLEADAPVLAFYALAKEGKLEELSSMSPTRIAREIALAEIRGEKLAKAVPQSKAPAPIKKAKASGVRKTSVMDMTPSELIKHIEKGNK